MPKNDLYHRVFTLVFESLKYLLYSESLHIDSTIHFCNKKILLLHQEYSPRIKYRKLLHDGNAH